jgi:hypothetical protein
LDSDHDLYEEETTPHLSGLLSICGPSSYLLVALLALIIAYPFYGGETLGRRLLFGVLTSAVLVSGAFAASQKKRTVVMALALAAPALGLQWFYTLSGGPIVADLLALTVAAFYAFTVANVLGYVLGSGPVTGDKLHAAVAAYILTALLWTALYALVDRLVPGSFSVNGISDLGAPLSWKELLFFSFTTLTSTGYGGIVPAAGHAQSLAILEQLAGVFYVAILIARLAGLYQPGASRRSTWRTRGSDGVAPSGRKGRAKRGLLRVAARLVRNSRRD